MAKDAGMQYVVFSTKHHDGFNMFDTKQTDFKITNPEVPFSKTRKAILPKKYLMLSEKGLWVGAYFLSPTGIRKTIGGHTMQPITGITTTV